MAKRSGSKRAVSPFRPTLFAGLAVVALLTLVWLLPAPQTRHEATPTPTLAPVLAGADVSWPDCRRRAATPGGFAFGIVGVNDGEPNTRNPCLTEQVAWAAASTGGTAQPRIGYYAIGANPFSARESKWVKPVWPASALWQGHRVAIPAAYGRDCRGRHTDRACAYVFGWVTAWRDAHLAGVVGAAAATWWIDVETERDWAGDPLWNQALVEGMAAYFGGATANGGLGARAGIYSNAYFWGAIVGPLRAGSPLAALPNWYPIGPATRAEAETALTRLSSVTPEGRIEIVQHVVGGLDRNVAAARVTSGR